MENHIKSLDKHENPESPQDSIMVPDIQGLKYTHIISIMDLLQFIHIF